MRKYDIDLSTLIDISDNPFNSGIFTALQNYAVPWAETDISLYLNMYYYGNYSGNKIISPLLEKMIIEHDSHKLTVSDLNTLAAIIFNLYGITWNRLYEVYTTEYNPIENYNMVESSEDNHELTHGKTETVTNNLTNVTDRNITTTPDLETVTNIKEYGFNSSEGVNKSDETTTQTGTNDVEEDTTITNRGTQTFVNSGIDETNITHELTRHGNIGVTSNQQMIQSEIELWKWNFFRNVVFPNIDSIMTTTIY